jgi:hypothetical protein
MLSLQKIMSAATVVVALGTATAAIAQSQPATVAPASAASESAARKFTVFVHVKTRDAWLKLTVPERLSYIGKNVFPILARNPLVKMRFHDAEFYSARLSDVMVFETTDLIQYERVIDDLRDSAFWHTYFDVLDIILTSENPLVDFSRARTVPKQ